VFGYGTNLITQISILHNDEHNAIIQLVRYDAYLHCDHFKESDLSLACFLFVRIIMISCATSLLLV
jgi:hypothetical protein